MNFTRDLGSGRTIHLENRGERTILTLSTIGVGQQQQSSNSYDTGIWIKEPEIKEDSEGITVTVFTKTGTHRLTPNNRVNMEPLPPLKMGDMEMSFKPMEMRMGNMRMSMGDGDSNRRENAN